MKAVEGWRKLIAYIFAQGMIALFWAVQLGVKESLSAESAATYSVYALGVFAASNTAEWVIKKVKGKGN